MIDNLPMFRAAGMLQGLHGVLAATADWNSLSRAGVLRLLADLQAQIEPKPATRTVSMNLIEAQAARDR